MGRRGPAPLPTKLLEKRGSWRAHINPDEPKPPAGDPQCPEWLDEGAKAMWAATAPLLIFCRILTSADINVLTRYCQLWTRWRRAEEFIMKNGDVYPIKAPDGRLVAFVPFPQVSIANKLSHALRGLEQELGLTPSARTRIRMQPAHPTPPQQPYDPVLAAKRRAFFESPSTNGMPPPPGA